jgi:type VI secretion system secreted protein Hcp
MKRSLSIILLTLGLGAGPIHAAHVDFYLKVDGIDGESTDDKHKGQIEILSFSFGVDQPGSSATGGGGGAGKASFSDMTFSAHASKASPKLFLACATGQHIPSATFVIHRDGETNAYYKVVLQDILVTSFQSSGSAEGDVVPTDQFSVNFAQVKLEYTSVDGTVTSGEAIRPTLTQ